MKDLLYAIQDLFLMLFKPLDALREIELTDWWTANIVSWLFLAIFTVAMVYWLLQLKKFNANDSGSM